MRDRLIYRKVFDCKQENNKGTLESSCKETENGNVFCNKEGDICTKDRSKLEEIMNFFNRIINPPQEAQEPEWLRMAAEDVGLAPAPA